MRYLFVGECRSDKAKRMGVTWRDGRLAAKPLFEALEASGLVPARQSFINLFLTDGKRPRVDRVALGRVLRSRLPVVGMGRKVQAVLDGVGVKHLPIVHPAARGRIRRRDRYVAHVKSVLAGHDF